MSTPMRRQNVFSKLAALSKSAPIDFRNAAYWVINSFSFISDLPNRSPRLVEALPYRLSRKRGWYRLFDVRDDHRSLSSTSPRPEAESHRRAVRSAVHSAVERHPSLAADR